MSSSGNCAEGTDKHVLHLLECLERLHHVGVNRLELFLDGGLFLVEVIDGPADPLRLEVAAGISGGRRDRGAGCCFVDVLCGRA